MSIEPVDARWPKLLSLAVHEFRTPITVVAGYIRMLLKDRAGAITDQQRKLLEEAEKSCGRLSALVAEMSDLSALEGGKAGINAGQVDIHQILTEAITSLPPLPDREVQLTLEGGGPIPVAADATRIKTAVTSLLSALRREVITSDRMIVRVAKDAQQVRITMAAADQVDGLTGAAITEMTHFDEWRGGSGLSLAIARRILGQHGGALYGPPGDGKAAAVVVLPAS